MSQSGPSSFNSPWRIQPVGPDQRRQVLHLIADSGGLWAMHSLMELPPPRGEKAGVDQLWVGMEGQKTRAAVWIMPRPGRTAMIFITRPARRGLVENTARVIDHACRAVDADHATLVQAMLDESADLEQLALSMAGFKDLACLEYMQRPIGRHHQPPQLPPGFALRTYNDNRRADFIAMLDASYEQTLDCPSICGRRRTEDVFEGHRAAGQFLPELWTLVTWHDEPVGVMLLASLPQHQLVELVYLGLSLKYRGRGWGKLLLEHALHQCVRQQASWLCTAVDRDNQPARKLYQSMGFDRTATKLAMIRPLVDKL